MIIEFKKCPCCGNAPKIVRSNFDGKYFAFCGCGITTRKFSSEAELMIAWNRRYEVIHK